MRPFLFLFLLLAADLFAQQPHVDPVQRGIKSVKRMSCGYSGSDSTGLQLVSEKRYAASGKAVYEVHMGLVMYERGDEVESDFYVAWGSLGNTSFDTTRWKYDAKGRLKETRFSDCYGSIDKIVYSYNEKGQCVKEQSYRNGKLESGSVYTYTAGMMQQTNTYKGKPNGYSRTYYDSAGREIARVHPAGKYRSYDSTVTRYGENERWITSGEYTTHNVFRPDGSPVSSTRYKKGETLPEDSSYYHYNSRGRLDEQFQMRRTAGKKEYYSERTYWVTDAGDTSGWLQAIVKVSGNDTTWKETYTRIDERTTEIRQYEYGKLWERRVVRYNEKGDMVENRLYNTWDELLQRDVYVYTYY
jgi:antitoxin component YwqK of YwqJK toxin-antitoxin module